MGTTLSDIIVPELFNPYVIQKTLEKSALVQSGIVQNDAEFDKLASQASPLVNMPFFSDLTGESETIIEGDDLTADKIRRCGNFKTCKNVECNRPFRRNVGC